MSRHQNSAQTLGFQTLKLGIPFELGFLLLRGRSLWAWLFLHGLAPSFLWSMWTQKTSFYRSPGPNSFCGKLEHACFLLCSFQGLAAEISGPCSDDCFSKRDIARHKAEGRYQGVLQRGDSRKQSEEKRFFHPFLRKHRCLVKTALAFVFERSKFRSYLVRYYLII